MKNKSKNVVPVGSLLAEANAFLKNGQFDQSERVFKKLLSAEVNHPGALYSLAVIESRRGNFDLALAYLDRVVKVAPRSVDVWIARGQVLRDIGRRAEALSCFDRVLGLDPNCLLALNESAVLLHGLFKRSDAIGRLERSIGIMPTGDALSNLSTLYAESMETEDLNKAIISLERLVALEPNYPFAIGRLMYQKLHVCQWSNYRDLTPLILAGLRAGKSVCSPIPCMVMSSESDEHQRCAQSYAPFFFNVKRPPMWAGQLYQHKKIRVAYVSPDLRDHPVGQLMLGVLGFHDKTRFEVIAFSTGPNTQDTTRLSMELCFDKFIDVNGLPKVEVAKLIRSMEIDIAVDLAGYTSWTGSEAFAYRPAPIQVNFLGFPGTLGTDFMDYVIADRYVIPEDQQVFYNEKVKYLPDTYLPTNGNLELAAVTPTRAECGLPPEGFIFCSFSHDHKINPLVFDIWMQLLQQTTGSVLWLMSRLQVSEDNLRREASVRGIDPNRLVFAKRLPLLADHLARYRLADLFLDTFPYNAHTTAADALFVGLPVLTCMGNAFPSRVAGSLLHAVGMPEMITHSLSDYAALALRLASDSGAVSALKDKLSKNKETYPLFNTELYCRNLEAVFQSMFQEKWGTQSVENADHSGNCLRDGIKLQEQGKTDEAERLIRLHLKSHPKDGAALYALVTILIGKQNLSEAQAFIEFAVIQVDQFAPLWFARGVVAAQLRQHNLALSSYDRAIELNPGYVEALNNSCVLLYELQRTDEAVLRYHKLMVAKQNG